MTLSLIKRGDLTRKMNTTDHDANMTAIEEAVNGKVAASEKGAADGVAELDESGEVVAEQLPAATATAKGVVELATTAEAIAHTDTSKAVTPAGLLDIYTKLQGILTDGWLLDSRRWLDMQMRAAVSGELVGSEGPVRLVLSATVTPNQIQTVSRNYGLATLVFNNTLTAGTEYGSNSYISANFYGLVFGDSGTRYVCTTVVIGGGVSDIRYIDIHPEYGDVVSDFTSGADYDVYLFVKDTANPVTGTLERPEFVLGDDIDTPAKMYAALNAPMPDGSTPFTDRAPDPTFEQDGEDGGWLLIGAATISGGQGTVSSASDAIRVLVADGTEVLIDVTIDNSSGVVKANGFGDSVTLSNGRNLIRATVDAGGKVQVFGSAGPGEVLEFHVYEIADIPGAIQPKKLSDTVDNTTYRNVNLSHSFKQAGLVSGVYLLSSVGQWVALTRNAYVGSTSLSYNPVPSSNIVAFNVAATYAVLGYSSLAEMIANSAIKIIYTHNANPFESCPITEDVVRETEVHYTQSGGNADFVSWLTDEVPTGSTVAIDSAKITTMREGSVGNLIDAIGHEAIDEAASGPGVVWMGKLVEDVTTGTYWVEIPFIQVKDLAQYSGELTLGDYVTTRAEGTDIVKFGCKRFDTGRAVVGG